MSAVKHASPNAHHRAIGFGTVICFGAVICFAVASLSCSSSPKKVRHPDEQTTTKKQARPRPAAPDPDLAKMPRLIPRRVLFDNPEKTAPRISPNGKLLAYLAPVDGVLNVWVQTVGKNDAHPITQDKYRGIRRFFWAKSSKYILYLQDVGGNENYRLYKVNPATKKTTLLTPKKKVRAGVVALSKRHPKELLITLNKRDPRLFDVYRLNLETGDMTLEAQNPGSVLHWVADYDYQVRGALAMDPKGNQVLLVRKRKKGPGRVKGRTKRRDKRRTKRRDKRRPKDRTVGRAKSRTKGRGDASAWRKLRVWSPLEQGGPVAFTRDGQSILAMGNKDSDKKRLYTIEIKTGEIKEIFSGQKADLAEVEINPDDHKVEAVAVEYKKLRWKPIDPRVKADFAALEKIAAGKVFGIINRSNDDRKWVVGVTADTHPVRFYLYDRNTQKATLLFDSRPKLREYTLASVKPVVIPARDGLQLVSYLTRPPGRTLKKGPLVLFVHGGPWSRNRWAFNSRVQWLANRGYTVLQVNFRGSRGFGKKFLNAGNKEWGRKMQHDLTDAVKWAIAQGRADPKRVAIMGGSYGGYAALAGVTFTPDLYRAAVDIVGPSNIITLLKSVPPYWKPMQAVFRNRVGDIETEREMLEARSPLNHAHKITTPLIIFQGKNDPRVKMKESDQIVQAIRKREGQVRYIVYPDEGHGFRRPPNKLDFYGRTERFLARHLGGRAEPFKPIKGATAVVK
jgi:dipeptidyl aminopeptidase/acylaminoacyl peptidase